MLLHFQLPLRTFASSFQKLLPGHRQNLLKYLLSFFAEEILEFLEHGKNNLYVRLRQAYIYFSARFPFGPEVYNGMAVNADKHCLLPYGYSVDYDWLYLYSAILLPVSKINNLLPLRHK